MKRIRHLLAVAAVAGGTVAVGDVGPASADHRNFRAMGAVLRGENENPPADPAGFGAAGVVINVSRGTLCYFVSAARIEQATLAHIHAGGPTVNGPVVVHFEAPSDGFSADCLTVSDPADRLDPAVLTAIAHNPSGFYVNVHNTPFPGGAIRGQLR